MRGRPLQSVLGAVLWGLLMPVAMGAPETDDESTVATVEAQRRAIVNVYRSKREGARLYDERDYDGAYPYLMNAAKHGLKDSQARLGYMHLNGLGPAKKDARLAVGWLGVAADGVTRPDIRKVFKEVYGKVPRQHRKAFDKIIDKFIVTYGTEVNDVKCRRQNKQGSQIKVVNCLITDPDGYLVADTLDRAIREVMPGASAESTPQIWEPREAFGSTPGGSGPGEP